jgi:hypothetical protein
MGGTGSRSAPLLCSDAAGGSPLPPQPTLAINPKLTATLRQVMLAIAVLQSNGGEHCTRRLDRECAI